MQLVGQAGNAATTLRFVADTPTITMSRLKALLTGGLPTFLDVGSSFSASQVTEDNIVSQLKAAGKGMAFVGDDTWQQLAPDAFEWSWPYPSFNVKDLHSVDDGVWKRVLPLLREGGRCHGCTDDCTSAQQEDDNRGSGGSGNGGSGACSNSGKTEGVGSSSVVPWDVLVGHYLGVDHAGHSHGVKSAQMVSKLDQMDAQLAAVIGLMAQGAGPRGPYERALLLILSDHGQTLGGDHGGGAPDEAETVLVAVSPAKLRERLMKGGQQRLGRLQQQQQEEAGGAPEGLEGLGPSPIGDLQLLSEEQLDNLQDALSSEAWTAASADGERARTAFRPASGAEGSQGDGRAFDSTNAAVPLSRRTCGSTIPQIDLTPTLALLLGVPIPYGNLGTIPSLLWEVLAVPGPGKEGDGTSSGRGGSSTAGVGSGSNNMQAGSSSSSSGGAASEEPWLPYTAALAANAAQVHTYLNHYARAAKLPAKALARCNELFATASKVAEEERGGDGTSGAGNGGDGRERVAAAWLEFLGSAASLARAQFTQFHGVFVWGGVVAIAAVVGLHLYLCWSTFTAASGGGGAPRRPLSQESWALAALQLVHTASLFSVGALMGEGRLQCHFITAATLLTVRSALASALRARSRHAAAAARSVVSGKPAATGAAAAAGVGPGKRGTVVWIVLLGAALLACNHLLQRVGLIDRFGQDPHDKTEPTGELLGPSDAGLRARHLAATLGPLAGCLLLWLGASSWLSRAAAAARAGAGMLSGLDEGGGSGPGPLVALARASALMQLALVTAFWWVRLMGGADLTAEESLMELLAAAENRMGGAGGPLAAAAAALLLSIRGAWGGALLAAAEPALRLPLRLLLPRVVYLLSLLALGVAAVAAAARPVCWLLVSWRRSRTAQGGRPPPAQSHPNTALWLVASASGPVVLSLGYKGPAVVFLGALQAACLLALLVARQEARRGERGAAQSGVSEAAATPAWLVLLGWPAPTRAAPGSPAAGRKPRRALPGPPREGVVDGDGVVLQSEAPDDDDYAFLSAALFSMYGLQLFFCSGHFCEFSGLQYASSFIGFDEMEWYVSGPLLLINTFGGLMLVCLAVPLAVAVGRLAASQQHCGPGLKPNGGSPAGAAAGSGTHVDGGQAADAGLSGALLLVSGARAAALGVCIASAAVQQGHILLWAIFAPKLVFEMWLCAVADAFLLLAAVLARAW